MSQGSGTEHCTVFIGGLPLSAEWQDVHDYLVQFGEPKSLHLPRCKKTNRIKGYAKATLASPHSVALLLRQPRHIIRGLSVGISLWKKKTEYVPLKDEERHRKVHVRFEVNFSREQLEEYFSKFGSIQHVDLRCNPITQEPRNFCYITFDSAASALKVASIRNHSYYGNSLICEMSKPIHFSPSGTESQTPQIPNLYKDAPQGRTSQLVEKPAADSRNERSSPNLNADSITRDFKFTFRTIASSSELGAIRSMLTPLHNVTHTLEQLPRSPGKENDLPLKVMGGWFLKPTTKYYYSEQVEYKQRLIQQEQDSNLQFNIFRPSRQHITA